MYRFKKFKCICFLTFIFLLLILYRNNSVTRKVQLEGVSNNYNDYMKRQFGDIYTALLISHGNASFQFRNVSSKSVEAVSALGLLTQSKPRTVHDFLSHDQMYISDNKERCSMHSQVFVIIVIFSAPGNSGNREKIRRKLNRQIEIYMKINFIFLMGEYPYNVSGSDTQLDIEDESMKHGDIVQGKFEDTYRNLTLKSATMLGWIRNHCYNSTFVLKMDDDLVFDVHRIYEMFQRIGRITHGFIMGNRANVKAPIRDPNSKYYMTVMDYMLLKYPDYCKGPAYVLTTNTIERLWRSTYHMEFFQLEDVYLTGLLRKKAGIPIQNPLGENLFCGRDIFNDTSTSCGLAHH